MKDRSLFDRRHVFKSKLALADPGIRFFDDVRDVDLLLAFLWQFQQLNWIPPKSAEQLQLLGAHDLLRHERNELAFYEFRLRGPRDDREPPLTLFIHMDYSAGFVRLIGFHRTADLKSGRKRKLILDTIAARAGIIERRLKTKRNP